MIDLVADVLQYAGITGPPIRLPLIADALGMILRPDFDLPKGWDALLTRGMGRSLCSYDPNRPDQRIRFSLAHEVGHLLLHKGKGYALDGRALNSRDERRMEREADNFAAELLMPGQWVLDSCLDDPSFDDLRDRFWVSRPAMRRRLDALGLRVSATSYPRPTYADWRIWDHEDAYAVYGRRDPYEEYLRMRGVLERGVCSPKAGWKPRATDSAATSPVVLIRP